jgi:hypothetical protein
MGVDRSSEVCFGHLDVTSTDGSNVGVSVRSCLRKSHFVLRSMKPKRLRSDNANSRRFCGAWQIGPNRSALRLNFSLVFRSKYCENRSFHRERYRKVDSQFVSFTHRRFFGFACGVGAWLISLTSMLTVCKKTNPLYWRSSDLGKPAVLQGNAWQGSLAWRWHASRLQ